MTAVYLWMTAAVLLIIDFLLAWACYSLRDFSRSRLDEICRRHNNEARFGLILKQYERILLAAEIVYLAVTVAIAVITVALIGQPSITDPVSELLLTAFEVVGALLVLLASVVVVPWSLARVAGESFLYRSWPCLRWLATLLRPMISFAFEFDKIAHRVSGLQPPTENDAASLTEEIRTVVDEGQRGGILESEARTMIHRVMELQEEDVAAVMTPRTDMICISVDATLEEARERLLEAGHSRVPIIGETTDDIVGILYAKDLLRYLASGDGEHLPLRTIVREPFYVPETTGIDSLLETMKREHVHVAIVLDEYGGVAGLVTMEDVLEEIVGEIVDEYDHDEEEPIRVLDNGSTEVDARVHIDDLNEQFGYELPEDTDYDTIGGFVFSHLGRVPITKERLTWRQLQITVLEADKRKIIKLRIDVDKSLAAAAAEES